MSGLGRPAVPRPVPERALVAFSGETQLAWLRLLKPGFRHCFVLLDAGCCWVRFDPLATAAEIALLPAADAEALAAALRAQGLTIVAATPRRPLRPLPPGPWSCVEAVKRLLGLRAPFLLTPWQLYRRLAREAAENSA